MNVKKYSEYPDIGKKTVKLKQIPFEKWKMVWENVARMVLIDCILILIHAGVHGGELLDIKIENIQISERYMIGESKTEAGKDRVIPLHERIIPLVKK